jgi:hypothetical protein
VTYIVWSRPVLIGPSEITVRKSALKKLWFIGCLAFAVAGTAIAADSPKDVEAALHQGNYQLAEQELRQAIADHPQSAKAHYILAQVLAHEGNIGDAQKEAGQAKQLDPKIGFTDPARFAHFEQELGQALAPAGTHRAASVGIATSEAQPAASRPEAAHASVWPWLIGGVIVVLLIGMYLRRQREANGGFNNGGYAGMRSPAPNAPPYSGYPPGYPPQAPPGGSGMGSSFVGGLAGGALGAAAVEMFEGHERRAEEGNTSNAGTPSPAPGNDPQTQAYDDLRSNPIDTGNDDSGWGGGDSLDSGSDDDSWS